MPLQPGDVGCPVRRRSPPVREQCAFLTGLSELVVASAKDSSTFGWSGHTDALPKAVSWPM
jgi:hypothetical protein